MKIESKINGDLYTFEVRVGVEVKNCNGIKKSVLTTQGITSMNGLIIGLGNVTKHKNDLTDFKFATRAVAKISFKCIPHKAVRTSLWEELDNVLAFSDLDFSLGQDTITFLMSEATSKKREDISSEITSSKPAFSKNQVKVNLLPGKKFHPRILGINDGDLIELNVGSVIHKSYGGTYLKRVIDEPVTVIVTRVNKASLSCFLAKAVECKLKSTNNYYRTTPLKVMDRFLIKYNGN